MPKTSTNILYSTVLTKELTSNMYIASLVHVWDIQVINSCATVYTTCNNANRVHKKNLSFCYFPSDFRSQQSFGRWQVFSHVLKPRLPSRWGKRGRDWDELISNIRNILCLLPHGSVLFLGFSLVRGCKTESTTISSNKRTKRWYQSHSHSLQTSVRLVYIFPLKKLFLTAPNVENNWEGHVKHLKVLLKWNWRWNCICDCTISLNFEIHFLEFP